MVTESMLAAPPAVVPVTRMVLVPAVRGTEMDAVAQVSQLAVTGKLSVPREVPLTEMVAGGAALVPSEYRRVGGGDRDVEERADRVGRVGEAGTGEAGVVGVERATGGQCAGLRLERVTR